MFSINLKKLRNEKGISQKSLAEELYVSQQTVAKWETDKATPNPEMLKKIASYFNISVDSLLGYADSPFSLFQVRDMAVSKTDLKIFMEARGLSDKDKAEILAFIDYKKLQKKLESYSLPSDSPIFTTADFEDGTERIAAFGGMEENDDEPLTT